MTSITNPNAIRCVQLRAQISAVKMEAMGMKRRGPSLTSQLKRFYGLPMRCSYDMVLESLKDDLAQADEEFLADAQAQTGVQMS